MGLKLIIAGMIFLFNPTVSIYDFLPDVIGWALIFAGMAKLRDICPSFEDAAVWARRLIWLNAAQLGVMALLPLMTDTAYALTFTFVFAGGSAALMIFFFYHFTEGLRYVSSREGCDKSMGEVSTFRSMCTVFAVVRGCLTLLPELAYLSTTEYEGYITAIKQFDLANYKHLLYALNVVGVTIFGIIWLNIALRFLNRVRRDTEYMSALEKSYTERYATMQGTMFFRKLNTALILFGVGFVFQIDLMADGYCLTPDFAAPICFIVGASVLLRSFPELVKFRWMSVLYLGVSALAFVVMCYLAHAFYSYGITRSIMGFYTFIAFIVIAAVAAALFVVTLFRLLPTLDEIIEDHTGEKLDPTFRRMQERLDEMKASYRHRLKWFKVLGIASAASSVVRYALMYAFPQFWIIDAVVQAVWVWISVGLVYDLSLRAAEHYGVKKRTSEY